MKGLIFTYVLTYGGAAASLVNPYYGFLIYVCFGIIRPPGLWPWAVPAGNYSRIIAGALILGWIAHGFGSWRFGRGGAILGWLSCYWLIVFLSLLQVRHQDDAWWYFETLSKILLPLLIGCTLIDSVAKIKQLVWVMVLSQGFVAYEMNLSYFQGFNRLYRQGFATLDNNTAAVSMVVCAAIAFFLALHERARWRQGVALAIFLLSTHAVMFSFSRGALLSLIISGGVAFVVLPKRPVYVAALVMALLVGNRLAGKEVVERFLTVFVDAEERDESAASRLSLWKGCLAEMAEHPLLGIGPDQWKYASHRHGLGPMTAAHSMWMQTAAECGALGFGALLLTYLVAIARLWPLARGGLAESDPELAGIAQMVVSALVGYLVAAQFVSVGLVEIPYYVLAVGVGALKLASQPAAARWPAAPPYAPLREGAWA
jgi:probable O-glycosylation ligase (exosortase A-associated)